MNNNSTHTTQIAALRDRDDAEKAPLWHCLSHVSLLTLAMRDAAAAETVIAQYPDLPVPDEIGAAIFAARKAALSAQYNDDLPHDRRAALTLEADQFKGQAPSWTMETFTQQVLTATPTKNARRVALSAAQHLHRLENPVFPLTDAGNGERLTFHQYGQAVYCVEWKKWLLWNGQRWEADTRNAIFSRAKETARKIPEEAKSAGGDDYTAILKWAIKTEAKERLNAMIFLAATEEGMSVEASALDADTWLFNVANGTLDLKTGKLRPHDRADLLTKISPICFDPQAECPLFLDFLSKVFRGRASLIQFMQRVIGYSLTGEVREQIFLVLYGGGSNGKGVLLKILLRLFADYGHTMQPKTIYAKHDERMPSDVANLAGVRLAACNEGDEGKRLAEATVKQFTGDDAQLTGERKYENEFNFTPQFQIFFATNHKPEIRGTDNAIWRRVQLVPFEVKFWNAGKGETGPTELEADTELFGKLIAEMPGILNWALQGCLDWQRDGLGTPEEVVAATQDYRAEQDRLSDFFAECCYLAPSNTARASDLYAAFTRWGDASGEAKMSQRAFGSQLKEREFTQGREAGTGKTIWQGIGLRANQAP